MRRNAFGTAALLVLSSLACERGVHFIPQPSKAKTMLLLVQRPGRDEAHVVTLDDGSALTIDTEGEVLRLSAAIYDQSVRELELPATPEPASDERARAVPEGAASFDVATVGADATFSGWQSQATMPEALMAFHFTDTRDAESFCPTMTRTRIATTGAIGRIGALASLDGHRVVFAGESAPTLFLLDLDSEVATELPNIVSSTIPADAWTAGFHGSDGLTYLGTRHGRLARIDAQPELQPLPSTPTVTLDAISAIGGSAPGAAFELDVLTVSGIVLRFDGASWRTLATPPTWQVPLEADSVDIARTLNLRGDELIATRGTQTILRFRPGQTILERVDDPTLGITSVVTSTRFGDLATASGYPISSLNGHRLSLLRPGSNGTWSQVLETDVVPFANQLTEVSAGFLYCGDAGAVGVYLPDRSWLCTPLRLSLVNATKMISVGSRWLVSGRPKLAGSSLELFLVSVDP